MKDRLVTLLLAVALAVVFIFAVVIVFNLQLHAGVKWAALGAAAALLTLLQERLLAS